MQRLANWTFGLSGSDAANDLRGDVAAFAPGSRNLMPDGAKQSRPWRGMTYIGDGAAFLRQITDTWGGLDYDGATPPKGSLFSSIADMLVYIGQGQVMYQTNDITGAIASNVLRFLLKWNGVYTDANSGPYEAGLPEPAAPDVGIIDTSIYGTPNLTGTVSIKYARLRKTTGGRSRASVTSQVLTVNANAIYAVVPAAVSGQTHHIFFGTDTRLGGIGLHYRIGRANPFTQQEYTEEDVERKVTITSVTSTDTLNAASGTFKPGDIGKLVENVSGTLTVDADTTVAEWISSSQIKLSKAVSVTGSGVVTLVAYAGEIRRSVVLNWLQSDLIEETAWTLDFPPTTGSHAFQLENRMFVCGYADATGRKDETTAAPDSSASSANPGTALLPSLPNQFESYDPRYPIYLPEAVVDILSDGMESYKFIGGKNGIYAAQYLNVTDSPPLTLTVLLRGEGIAHPGNWCARERAIYLYTGKGQPVRIIEGGRVDKEFAAPVRYLMRNVAQSSMHVCGHPQGGGVIYAWGNQAVCFDEVTGRWSTVLLLKGDNNYKGNVVSAVATQSRLIITLDDGAGNRKAFYIDEDASKADFVVGVGHYQDGPLERKPKLIRRVAAAAVRDLEHATTVYLGLHLNTLPTHVADVAITAGSNILTSASGKFSNELLGAYVLIRGAGTGATWLFGRIGQVDSPTQVRIVAPAANLADAAALNAVTTTSAGYMLIAQYIFPFTPNRLGTVEMELDEILIPNAVSYAVSMAMETDGIDAQPLFAEIDGEVVQEVGWAMPSATFASS